MHKSVLLEEVISGLDIKKGNVYVDTTFGGGGHTKHICNALGVDGVCICVDRDSLAIDMGKTLLGDCKAKKYFVVENFRNMESILRGLNINIVDKIFFDLGFSSYQMDDKDRGFSIKKDGPLLMTYKSVPDGNDLTAEEVVNTWDKENLADIIYGFGEEMFARRIAQKIVEEREKNKITSTFQLRDIVESAVPTWYRKKKIHPATKTFQAIRIAVNNELGSLSDALLSSWKFLSQGGRIVVISFQSLEDRIVKRFFKERSVNGEGRLINKKVIVPTKKEILDNPRSRSAKLRIIEKI